MNELINLSNQQKQEIKENAHDAVSFLGEIGKPETGILERTKEVRYADSVLERFGQILDFKILEKEETIRLSEAQVSELQNPENRDRFDISQSDNSQDITIARSRVESDKKILRQFKNARGRVHHKTYGICFDTRKLISIPELLSQPGRKTLLAVKKARLASA